MAVKEFKQIHNFVGKIIEVEFRDGRLARGTLSFFDWKERVIHLSDYELHKPTKEGADKKTGEILIINSKVWNIAQGR